MRLLVSAMVIFAVNAAHAERRPPYLFWDDGNVLRVRFAKVSEDAPLIDILDGDNVIRSVRARARPSDEVPLWEARIGQACNETSGLKQPIDADGVRIPGTPHVLRFSLPPCAWDSTVRVSLLADTQMDTAAVAALLKQSETFRPDAYVIAGDLVQRGGSEPQWTAYFSALEPVMQRRVVLTVPGNHEYMLSDDAEPYRRYYGTSDIAGTERGELWRDVVVGPIRFFMLDSTVMLDDDLAPRQRAWFAQRLRDPDVVDDGRWRVAVMHHPPFSSSVAHIPVYFTRHQVAVRRDYVPLFEHENVPLVFAGHVHLFERSEQNGVHYLNAGPAGGLFGFEAVDNPATVHALGQIRTVTHLRADACSMTLQSRDSIGVLADAVTLRRPCPARRPVGRREVPGRYAAP